MVVVTQAGLPDGDCGNVAAVVRLGVLAGCLWDGACPAGDRVAAVRAGLAGKPAPPGLGLGLTLGLGKPEGLGLGKPEGDGFGVGNPDGFGFGLGHTLPFRFPWPFPFPLPLPPPPPKKNLHLGFFGIGFAWIHLLMPVTFSGSSCVIGLCDMASSLVM